MVAKLINTNHEKKRIPGQILYLSAKGRSYRIRPVQKTDFELLIQMFLKLSTDTLQKRFMRPYFKVNEEVAHEYVSLLWSGNNPNDYLIVATVRENNQEQAIAVAELRYSGKPGDPAEIALMVRDDYQREGVGVNLVQELAQEARARGIKQWKADTTCWNQGIRQLADKFGQSYKAFTRYGDTVIVGTF